MATFVLDGKASAELPRRPIAVALTVGGAVGPGARLLARARDGGEVRVVQHTGSLLILPRVDVEVVVAAVPDGGRDRFDQGTVLHVTLGPDDSGDIGADVIQLAPRDVSGLSFLELATLAPQDQHLGEGASVRVTTRLAIPDAPLPPVAAQARVACRGVLHADQIDEAHRVTMGCVVDTSVSMAPLFASGMVAAAADIVAGMAAVLSTGEPITLTVPGPATAGQQSFAGDALGGHLGAVPAPGLGFSVDVNAAITRPGGRSLTVVLTDGAGVVDTVKGVLALVLSDCSSATDGPGFAGSRCPLPPPGVDGREFLAGQPQLVSRVVGELLAAAGLAASSSVASSSVARDIR